MKKLFCLVAISAMLFLLAVPASADLFPTLSNESTAIAPSYGGFANVDYVRVFTDQDDGQIVCYEGVTAQDYYDFGAYLEGLSFEVTESIMTENYVELEMTNGEFNIGMLYYIKTQQMLLCYEKGVQFATNSAQAGNAVETDAYVNVDTSNRDTIRFGIWSGMTSLYDVEFDEKSYIGFYAPVSTDMTDAYAEYTISKGATDLSSDSSVEDSLDEEIDRLYLLLREDWYIVALYHANLCLSDDVLVPVFLETAVPFEVLASGGDPWNGVYLEDIEEQVMGRLWEIANAESDNKPSSGAVNELPIIQQSASEMEIDDFSVLGVWEMFKTESYRTEWVQDEEALFGGQFVNMLVVEEPADLGIVYGEYEFTQNQVITRFEWTIDYIPVIHHFDYTIDGVNVFIISPDGTTETLTYIDGYLVEILNDTTTYYRHIDGSENHSDSIRGKTQGSTGW